MNKKDFEEIVKYPIYKNEIEKSDKASKEARESSSDLTKKVENNMFLKQDNNQNGKNNINKRKFNGSFAPTPPKISKGNNNFASPENQSNRQNIIKQRNSLPIASAKSK